MLTTQSAPAATEAIVAVAPAPTAAEAVATATKKHPVVRVITPAGAQSPIVKYDNNPEFGYFRAESATVGFGLGQWARGSKRSTLIKGDIPTLEQILAEEVTDMTLPGKLVIREFVVDEDFISNPDLEMYRQMLDTTKDDLEDQIASSVKRAGKDGPTLKVGENPIVRFTLYIHLEADGSNRAEFDAELDIKVAHDNLDEVSEHQAKTKAAKLPQGGN